MLIRERPRITTALDKLRVFSNTATRLVNDTQADLVKNLQNLEPTVRALADVGPDLSTLLGYVPTFPFTQNFIDRAVRGDYFNVFAVVDMTVPRLKTNTGRRHPLGRCRRTAGARPGRSLVPELYQGPAHSWHHAGTATGIRAAFQGWPAGTWVGARRLP